MPSWSWASIGSPVLYRQVRDTDEPLIFYHGSAIELIDSKSPFGAIRSARLDLHGRLLPAKLERVLGGKHNGKLTMEIDVLTAFAEFYRVFDSEEEFEKLGNFMFFWPVFWTVAFIEMIYERASEQLPVVEALAICEESPVEVMKNHGLHGLVLVSEGANCYRRFYSQFWAPAAWLYCWARQTEQIIHIV